MLVTMHLKRAPFYTTVLLAMIHQTSAQHLNFSSSTFDLAGCVDPSGTYACYQRVVTEVAAFTSQFPNRTSTTPAASESLEEGTLSCMYSGCWNRVRSRPLLPRSYTTDPRCHSSSIRANSRPCWQPSISTRTSTVAVVVPYHTLRHNSITSNSPGHVVGKDAKNTLAALAHIR